MHGTLAVKNDVLRNYLGGIATDFAEYEMINGKWTKKVCGGADSSFASDDKPLFNEKQLPGKFVNIKNFVLWLLYEEPFSDKSDMRPEVFHCIQPNQKSDLPALDAMLVGGKSKKAKGNGKGKGKGKKKGKDKLKSH